MGEAVRVRGHRGAAALAPENTLQSFATALDSGVYAVEFDVRAAADGELVVIHDETVDRTTDGHGPVASYTVDELQELDAGNGATVPTLDETLAYFADNTDRFQELRVELKERGITGRAAEQVDAYDLLEQTVFHSFSYDDLAAVNGGAGRSIAVMEPYDGLADDAVAYDCDVVTVHAEYASRETVTALQEAGVAVDLWDVDDTVDAVETVRSYGPDYVGADDPRFWADYC